MDSDSELFERFPVIGMTDVEALAAAAANPIVAQLLALHQPHETVARSDGGRELRRSRQLSPLANSHPEIAAGLDRARNHDRLQAYPASVEQFGEERVQRWERSDDPHERMLAEACRLGIDPHDTLSLHVDEYPERVLLNTGRPPLPLRRNGCEYVLDDLRKHERRRRYYEGPHIVRAIAEAEALWRADLDRIVKGGCPIQAVMIHNSAGDFGTISYPVPLYGSPRRTVRLAFMDNRPGGEYQVCWFHSDEDGWQDGPIDAFMMVTCGALLRVFPTCAAHHARFQNDFGGVGLDFHYVSDRSFYLRGLPDDMYLNEPGAL